MESSKLAERLEKSAWTILVLGVGVEVAVFWRLFGVALPNPVNSILGLDTVAGLWYVTRAAGLLAYLLLWLSTVWGLAVASKIADPVLARPFTFDVHEFISLLAIGFTVVHVGALLMDSYMPFSVLQVLFPFIAPYRPFWVGLGVIAFYLTLIVTATFYLRQRIGHQAFRSIHLLSFLAYAGVTLHSIFAGTDSTLFSAKLIYVTSALVVVVLTVNWYVATRLKKKARRITSEPSLNKTRFKDVVKDRVLGYGKGKFSQGARKHERKDDG